MAYRWTWQLAAALGMVLIGGVAQAGDGKAPPDPAARMAALHDQADAYFHDQQPGGVVLVTRGDQVLLRKAYGLADVENAVPMQPDAALRLASVTKQFTALAVLQLVQAGKLSLDAAVVSLDPALNGPLAQVTVRQLLTQTSGIKNVSSIAASRAARREDTDAQRLLAYFKALPLEFTPGTQFRYSNSNYILLTHLIERVTGQPYATYMQQAVFEPLDMRHTRYDNHLALIPHRAHGYRRLEGQLQNADFISMSQPQGAGGLISTVDDMALWHRALRDHRLVSAALQEQAFAKALLADGKRSPYGFGWIIGQANALPDVEHGGFINGFNSYVVRVDSPDVFVTVLTNAEFLDPTHLAVRLAAIAADRPYPEAVPLPKDANDWLGRYRLDEGNIDLRQAVDGSLQMQREGDDAKTLTLHADGRYYLDDGLDALSFQRDLQGRAVMTLHDRLMGDTTGIRQADTAQPGSTGSARP
ncbi:MAG TPA: serine hydrolase domain-containing protein [Stenotrophomonas sp.]|jgi:CubicO group peptidase (beta-lactamase class C family)